MLVIMSLMCGLKFFITFSLLTATPLFMVAA